MTGDLTYMAAREHANDLLREAESFRQARHRCARRGRKFSLPRKAPHRTARAATVRT
jgi:hypothetical protein